LTTKNQGAEGEKENIMAENDILGTVMRIKVGNVRVTEERRHGLNNEVVGELARSIRTNGLLNPITVDTENNLVAGLHRLEAFSMLGLAAIPAVVKSLSTLQAELAEVDENIARRHLTALERGELLQRRKRLYQTMYPEAKKKTGQDLAGKRWAKEGHGAAKDRWSKKDQTAHTPQTTHARAESAHVLKDSGKAEAKPAKCQEKTTPPTNPQGGPKTTPPEHPQSFSKSVAPITGQAPRTINEDVQIAERINPAVKAIIRGTEIEERKGDLLQISRLNGKQAQLEMVESLLALYHGDEKPMNGPSTNAVCKACMNFKRHPLDEEGKAAGYSPLVFCEEGHFDDAEENMVPVKWDAHRNICPDFIGDIVEARGHTRANPRRKRGNKNYINLAEVLPPELMGKVHKFVPGPAMVFVPSSSKADSRQERVERIVAKYKETGSINATAKELGVGRANVRGVLREAGVLGKDGAGEVLQALGAKVRK